MKKNVPQEWYVRGIADSTGDLPFMAQTVHAEDTAAEQGQIPEKKSGVVTLGKD